MADGSASKGIGDEDENHLTISDKSINVTSEVYGDVAGKNSSVSERIRTSANEKEAHSLPKVNTEEKDYSCKTIDEVYKEMKNMASMLQEVHNVVTKPPPNPPFLPPVLQVNARLEQPFKRQDLLPLMMMDLLLLMMMIGAVFLALFYVGKKIDQVRLAARDAIKPWEIDGRPPLVTNKIALWNKGETSSKASKTEELKVQEPPPKKSFS